MYRRGVGQSLGGSPGIQNGRSSRRSPSVSRGWGRHWRLAWVLGLCALGTLLVTLLLSRSGPQDTPLLTDMEGQPTPAFCSRGRPPLVCAHGGDTRHLPPNTMQAFQAALDIGVDCVEVDAALTRDGELVVLHIREFQQLMGKKYRPGMQVGDVSWPELQSLSWPGGEKVMRVKEAVLQTSPFVDCVTLDVKTYQDRSGQAVDEDRLVEALTRLVHETGCHNCIIWAKSDKIVAGVARLSPGQRTGYILMNQTQQVREEGMDQPLRMEAPEVVGAYQGMVDPDLVQLLHAHHKQLYAWTVNDPVSMRSMLDAGVDALVTNHPLMAIQAIEWRTARCGGVGRDGSSPWNAPE